MSRNEMIMITVLRKLLQLLATCSPPRITVWASPSLAVAAVLPCQQLEVADNIIPLSSWPFLVLVRGGWQHPSMIIFTFWTFLILFREGQQYHLLILFPIHFRPATSSFIVFDVLLFFWPLLCSLDLTFVSLLEEAENILLSFLLLDIFVISTKSPFDPLFTIFGGDWQHSLLLRWQQ